MASPHVSSCARVAAGEVLIPDGIIEKHAEAFGFHYPEGEDACRSAADLARDVLEGRLIEASLTGAALRGSLTFNRVTEFGFN